MYTKEWYKESDWLKFVKNVEKIIRGSIEYHGWVALCREQGGYRCAITNLTVDHAQIEIHHTPYTLFDLVVIVMDNDMPPQGWCTFEVAHRVMKLHWNGFVGWVPLATTIHQAVHANKLVVPLSVVRGNWQEIERMYRVPNDVKRRVSIQVQKMQEAEVSLCTTLSSV